MSIDLTPEIQQKIALAIEVPEFPTWIENARQGDCSTNQKLTATTIPLSKICVREKWNDPISLDEVITTIFELIAKSRSQRAPTTNPVKTIAFNSCRPPQQNLRSKTSKAICQTPNIPPLKSFAMEVLGNIKPYNESWRVIARKAGFSIESLTKTEKEICEMLERVLIRGEGWGPKDKQKGLMDSIEFSPEKMSKHGMRKSRRTYQRAIKKLVMTGLVTEVSKTPSGARVVRPAWWVGICTDDPLSVWRNASLSLGPGESHLSPQCPGNVEPLSSPCRIHVAHPRSRHRNHNHLPLSTVTRFPGVTFPHTSDVNFLQSRVDVCRPFHFCRLWNFFAPRPP